MFNNKKSFMKRMLTESNKKSRMAMIDCFNLPELFERTFIEYYVIGLEIKQIAGAHSVDERTVKRWLKEGKEIAESHFVSYLMCHFNVPSESLQD